MVSKRKVTKRKVTKKVKGSNKQKKRSLKSTSVDELMTLLKDASEGLARSRTMQRQTHIHKLADIMHKIPVPDNENSLNITDNKKSFSSYYKKENSIVYDDKRGEQYMSVETETNSNDPFVHITRINRSKKGKHKSKNIINKINIPKSNTVIHANNLK